MRRLFVSLALCCVSGAAFAGDYSAALESNLRYLKPGYRQCTETKDCTLVANVCGGYLAVSNAKSASIAAIINKTLQTTTCISPNREPKPAVKCQDNLCVAIK
jgi:hypothetical protein